MWHTVWIVESANDCLPMSLWISCNASRSKREPTYLRHDDTVCVSGPCLDVAGETRGFRTHENCSVEQKEMHFVVTTNASGT
jgi:hypothetical protein